MDKTHLFKIIFQYHPEAKDEIRAGLKKIIVGPRDQIHVQSQLLGSAISARYYNLHIKTATDAAIHNMLESNSRLMNAIKEKPESCISLFLETGHIDTSAIPTSLSQSMSDANADIIESSINNPVHREKMTEAQFENTLVDSYRKSGFSIGELEKFSNLNSLPVVEGCAIARHFSAMLAQMDEKTAASVYTGMITMGK